AGDLGEVVGPLVLDLAAQSVVVHGIHLFTGGWADVALLGPRILLVDAPLDLGQHLDQLAAFVFAGLRFRIGAGLLGIGRRQRGQHFPDLRQQYHLLVLHGFDFFLRILGGIAQLGQRRWRQRRSGAPLGGFAAAGQRGLGDGAGLVRFFVGLGVDQDHFQRRVLEHAVEALGVDKAHRQQDRMDGNGSASAICRVLNERRFTSTDYLLSRMLYTAITGAFDRALECPSTCRRQVRRGGL